tara:strand:- start:24151 stop:24627 length:477 start_codon:yes stop_codon:yes gene_type:complete
MSEPGKEEKIKRAEEILAGLSEKARSEIPYFLWMRAYQDRNPFLRAKCATATEEMVEQFPELKRQAGFAVTATQGECEHWWCEGPDGDIYDPTEEQFPGGVLEYRKVQDDDLVRVGRCMNCGEDIYVAYKEAARKCICSRECELAFIRWQEGGEEYEV